MKTRLSHSPSRLLCIVVELLAFCLFSQAQVSAQTVVHEAVKTKMTMKVHLALGLTTLAQVTNALTQQTGLTIEADGYLQEHKLIMQMEDVSAETVLNTLAELNHWRWHETPQAGILVTHRLIPVPQKVADVSLALQAALPADFQRFLGSTGALRDSMYHEQRESAEARKKSAVQMGDMQGTLAIAEEWRNTLFALLKPDMSVQNPLAYARMNVEQKQALLVVLVLEEWARINVGSGHDLLQGVLRPYELDPANIEVILKANTQLMIGSTKIISPTRQQYAGFGASVHLTPSTPQPPGTASP